MHRYPCPAGKERHAEAWDSELRTKMRSATSEFRSGAAVKCTRRHKLRCPQGQYGSKSILEKKDHPLGKWTQDLLQSLLSILYQSHLNKHVPTIPTSPLKLNDGLIFIQVLPKLHPSFYIFSRTVALRS